MTTDQIENILRYHNQRGFKNDLKLLWGRIADMKESQSEISSFNFKLAVPANRNAVSFVEVYVIRNATLSETEMEAKELERFIEKLDRAIADLPENEKGVILSRYFTKDGSVNEFKNVAIECNYSENWCETLNKRALEHIDNLLCGYKIEWQTLR
ncbi:MAG: hypothetical protein WC365_07340 [Candidatus Babeliales bacterium]|jgi:DNA-directed RNA polymerase specialized sigma subunit